MSRMPDSRNIRNNGMSPTIENKTGAGILKVDYVLVIQRPEHMFKGFEELLKHGDL